ncbi:MAG: hypothetical protein ABI442_15895 [Gemmatimonadaceae bacterium]
MSHVRECPSPVAAKPVTHRAKLLISYATVVHAGSDGSTGPAPVVVKVIAMSMDRGVVLPNHDRHLGKIRSVPRKVRYVPHSAKGAKK